MTFEEILNEAFAMLKRQGRVSYRALKRQFDLDDDYLEGNKEALAFSHPRARDEEDPGRTGEPLAISPNTRHETDFEIECQKPIRA